MRHLLLIRLLFFGWSINAQIRQTIDLESFAEELFQLQDEDLNYESLYESLFLYYTNPINLNKTDRNELASLYILSPMQLSDFFNYRHKNGKLLSLYELQAIPGFDIHIIRKLLPFITLRESIDGRSVVERIFSEPNNYLLLRYSQNLQQSEGFRRPDSTGYLGNLGTIYTRFRVSHPNDFSLGFTMEKDEGEPFEFNKNSKGFDYYSFHFMLQNQGKFKRIAIGDYQLQMGQGLVLGSGFGAGKGAETINTIKRNSLGVRPYTSALESGFFRGMAATYSWKKIELTAFTSSLLQDANTISDSTYSDYDEFVNSIQASGFHRTASEIAKKNSIRENNIGIAVENKISAALKIGGTSLFTHFSRPIQKKPNNYNQFEFKGKQNLASSLYANWNWKKFHTIWRDGILFIRRKRYDSWIYVIV